MNSFLLKLTSFSWILGSAYIHAFSQPSVVITEILADPTPSFGLPEAEYIEILNLGNDTIHLSDLRIYDGAFRSLPAMPLPPNEYAVICDDNDTAEFTGISGVAAISSLSLTNSGESVTLSTTSGMLIDSVQYSDDWYGPGFKSDGGWSLERIDPGFMCHDPGNWEPSVSSTGGTPGALNSVNGIFSDDESPVALHAYSVDKNKIVMVFNEQVYIPLGMNQIGISGQSPALIIGHHESKSDQLLIQVPFNMVNGLIYDLFLNDLYDCSGNVMADQVISAGIADTSQEQIDIFINEVLFDPEDGCPEFIEVINFSNRIADLKGWKIGKADPETGAIVHVTDMVAGNRHLLPQEILVLTENGAIVDEFYRTTYPRNFSVNSDLPVLTNGGGSLLIMKNGIRMDEMNYDDDMHHPLLVSTKGISLEKIYPVLAGSDPDNWHSAASMAGFATPGSKNSQLIDENSQDGWINIRNRIFSPDNDGHEDVAVFTIDPPASGYILTARIYDLNASPRKEFGPVSLATGKNLLFWHGDDDTGSKLQPGPYVLHVKILHPGGDVRQANKAVIIAP